MRYPPHVLFLPPCTMQTGSLCSTFLLPIPNPCFLYNVLFYASAKLLLHPPLLTLPPQRRRAVAPSSVSSVPSVVSPILTLSILSLPSRRSRLSASQCRFVNRALGERPKRRDFIKDLFQGFLHELLTYLRQLLSLIVVSHPSPRDLSRSRMA